MRRRGISIAGIALFIAAAYGSASLAQQEPASPGRQPRNQREEPSRPSLWQRVTTGTKNLLRSPLNRPNDIPPLSEKESQVEPAKPKASRTPPSDVKKASHNQVAPQAERTARATPNPQAKSKSKAPAAATAKQPPPKSGGLFSRQPAKPRKTLTEYMVEERP